MSNDEQRLIRIEQKENGLLPPPSRPDLTPEELEAEREVEQKKIDEAVPLTEEETAEKEMLITQGFENWSRRDFQQFVRALETHGWYVLKWWNSTHADSLQGRKTSSSLPVRSETRHLLMSPNTMLHSKRSGRHYLVRFRDSLNKLIMWLK